MTEEQGKPKQGWIGVDLDGTLAEYHGWVNTFDIGKPIPAMVDRVRQWLSEGRDVRIFTARVDGGAAAKETGVPQDVVDKYQNIPMIEGMIEEWCEKHIGQRLPVTCKKDYAMIELWDDRCVQVIPNTGERADKCETANNEMNGREAVTGFVAWLTARHKTIRMGGSQECSKALELLLVFCDTNKLSDIRPGWPSNLIHPVKEG